MRAYFIDGPFQGELREFHRPRSLIDFVVPPKAAPRHGGEFIEPHVRAYTKCWEDHDRNIAIFAVHEQSFRLWLHGIIGDAFGRDAERIPMEWIDHHDRDLGRQMADDSRGRMSAEQAAAVIRHQLPRNMVDSSTPNESPLEREMRELAEEDVEADTFTWGDSHSVTFDDVVDAADQEMKEWHELLHPEGGTNAS